MPIFGRQETWAKASVLKGQSFPAIPIWSVCAKAVAKQAVAVLL
jgi:hypothetical protein